jgi:CheY-like chemotaxis protein
VSVAITYSPLAWLDSLPEGCVVLDGSLRVVYCNPVFAARYGYTADEFHGKILPAWLPDFAGSVLHRLCQEVLDKKTTQEGDETVGRQFFIVRAHPVPDGVLALIADVTARRHLEDGRKTPENHSTTRVDRPTPLPGALRSPTITTPTILIVDDEPFMRDLATRMLRTAGYQTRTAASGREAIALLRRDPASVQLILLDLLMPELDGSATLEALRQIRSDIPALFMTGQLEEDVRLRGGAAQTVPYLAKPYSLETLVIAVERALREK